jgi:hypothetical protein
VWCPPFDEGDTVDGERGGLHHSPVRRRPRFVPAIEPAWRVGGSIGAASPVETDNRAPETATVAALCNESRTSCPCPAHACPEMQDTEPTARRQSPDRNAPGTQYSSDEAAQQLRGLNPKLQSARSENRQVRSGHGSRPSGGRFSPCPTGAGLEENPVENYPRGGRCSLGSCRGGGAEVLRTRLRPPGSGEGALERSWPVVVRRLVVVRAVRGLGRGCWPSARSRGGRGFGVGGRRCGRGDVC